MEGHKKLFFNSQSLRNLLQKDQIHMKGMKTIVPSLEENSLVQSIISEEIGNQQSIKLLKTLKLKKEKEERKRAKGQGKSSTSTPNLLMRAVNAMMVNHNIFQYCTQRLQLPNEDITTLEQNYSRIKSSVASIMYHLQANYEELAYEDPNIFTCIMQAYDAAEPSGLIRPELEMFLHSPTIIQFYEIHYKSPKLTDRIFDWIWKRLVLSQLLILIGQFHRLNWRLRAEDFERKDYRRIVDNNYYHGANSAYRMGFDPNTTSAMSLLMNTSSTNLLSTGGSTVSRDQDKSVTALLGDPNNTSLLGITDAGRPISNPEYSSNYPINPNSSNVLYSQSTKLPEPLPRVMDKKVKTQYGFDESYNRPTPRALQTHYHGLRNNFAHPLDPSASAVASNALTPMEQIEQLRKELYISQLGIKQLNKVVDENITWVQNNCEINDKHLYLSQRARQKCKTLAATRLVHILQRWIYRILHFTIMKWKITIKHDQYSSMIKLFHYNKALVLFRKQFLIIYMKLLFKRWIQWYQAIRRQISHEKTAAAIQIQRIIRGFLGRKYCVKHKVGKSATRIQGLFRIIHAKKKVERLKKFRTYVFASLIVRRFMKKLVKIRQAKKELLRRKQKKASSKIQALFRGQKVRKDVIPQLIHEKEEEERRKIEEEEKRQEQQKARLLQPGIDGGDLEKVALKGASPLKNDPKKRKGGLASTTSSLVNRQSRVTGIGKAGNLTATARPTLQKKRDTVTTKKLVPDVSSTNIAASDDLSSKDEESIHLTNTNSSSQKEIKEVSIQSESLPTTSRSPLASARSMVTPRKYHHTVKPLTSPGVEIGIQVSMEDEFSLATLSPIPSTNLPPHSARKLSSRHNTPRESKATASSPLTVLTSEGSSHPNSPSKGTPSQPTPPKQSSSQRATHSRLQRLSFESAEQHQKDRRSTSTTHGSGKDRKPSTHSAAPAHHTTGNRRHSSSNSKTAASNAAGTRRHSSSNTSDPAVKIQSVARAKLARIKTKKMSEKKDITMTPEDIAAAEEEQKKKEPEEGIEKAVADNTVAVDEDELALIDKTASMVMSQLQSPNDNSRSSIRASMRGSVKRSFLHSNTADNTISDISASSFHLTTDADTALSIDLEQLPNENEEKEQLQPQLLPQSPQLSPIENKGEEAASGRTTPFKSLRNSLRLSISPLRNLSFFKNPFSSTPSAASTPKSQSGNPDENSTSIRPKTQSSIISGASRFFSSRRSISGREDGSDSEQELSISANRAKTAPTPTNAPSYRIPLLNEPIAEDDLSPNVMSRSHAASSKSLQEKEGDDEEEVNPYENEMHTANASSKKSPASSSSKHKRDDENKVIIPNDEAVLRIQLMFRRILAYRRYLRQKQKSLHAQQQAAALIEWSVVSIQKIARAKQGRKRFARIAEQKKLERENRSQISALKIQCLIRKRIAYKRVKHLAKLREEERQRIAYLKSLQKKKKKEEIFLANEDDEHVDADDEKEVSSKSKKQQKKGQKKSSPSPSPSAKVEKEKEKGPHKETEKSKEEAIPGLNLANVPQLAEIDNKIKYLEELEKRLKQSEENVKLEAQRAEERVAEQMRLLEEKTKQAEAERLAQQELMKLAVGPLSHRTPFMTTTSAHPPTHVPRPSSGGPSPMSTNTSKPPSKSPMHTGTGTPLMRTGGLLSTGGASAAPVVFHYEGNDWMQLWDANNQLHYWWCEKLQLSQWNRPDEEPSVAAEEYETNTESGYESAGAMTDYSTDHDVSFYSEANSEYGDAHNGDPSDPMNAWQEYWDEQAQAKYWYNNITGEASWTLPESLQATTGAATGAANTDNGWTSYIDEETGQLYWHNIHTGEVRWDY